MPQAMTPLTYLDRAMGSLRELGLVTGDATSTTSTEAPIVALLEKISDLDEERVVLENGVASLRTIPMFGLEDDLLAHYKWQAEHGLDASGHVFTNRDGGILTPWSFIKRDLTRVATAAGITDSFTLYSFRHTFATLHRASEGR